MKKQILQILFFLIPFISFSKALKLETTKCKITLDEEKRIEQMISFQSDYYKELFDIEFKPVQIHLFGRFKDYKTIRDSITLGKLKSKTGFYSGKNKIVYVYKHENFLRTIYHEINHALVRQKIKRIPSWINEGMAEFFEYFTVKSNGVTIRLQHGRLNKTKEWLNQNKITLREFLSYSRSEWRKKNLNPKGYSYTVSYAFIYYLYFGHPNAIGNILKHLNEGKTSIEALEIGTNMKIDLLEKKFKKFIL